MEISDLMKSLKPATGNRPQIPFPTNEALQRAAEAAAAASTSSSSSSSSSSSQTETKGATTNPFSRKQQYPVPQENLLRENTYSLPALISLESASSPKTRGSPATDRPYNGADVLVLQVWTGRPPAKAQGSSEVAANTPAPSKPIGGAKIPISAIVGGFPVRVSLGPQNALATATTDEGVRDWNDYLSSQSLWVRAAVCKGGGDNTGSETVYASPQQVSSCPSDYPTPVLEGIGFSKWIDLSSVVSSSASAASNAGSDAGGIRAPVSLVLAVPR
jgi:hypothetical protein